MTREEREKAIDALKISAPIHALTEEEFNDYIQTLNKVMDWLEQEPKTGHWIVWNTDSYDWTYKCDKCERIALKDSNYCPNCGAKMESESET